MKIVESDFTVITKDRNQMIDITARVAAAVKETGITNGDVIVFCPHTTAAITINENADPSVVHDMLMTLEELLPYRRAGYQHCEGNSDAHCKCSLIGASEQVILSNSKLKLGIWQGIYFCEFDGPRTRKVFLQIKGQ